MAKFKKVRIIETDDEGYLALKGLLPFGAILWARAVGEKVFIKLKDNYDLEYIQKYLNSFHRTFMDDRSF